MENDNSQDTHVDSFMIKIWAKEPVEEAGRVSWRRHMNHVPIGNWCYIQSVDENNLFLFYYLKEIRAEL